MKFLPLLLIALCFSCKKDTPYSCLLDPLNWHGFKIVWWSDSMGSGIGAIAPGWYQADAMGIDTLELIGSWQMRQGEDQVAVRGYPSKSSTFVKDRFLEEPSLHDRATVFFTGHNNSWQSDQIISDIEEMVSHLSHNRYIVLGLLASDDPGQWKGTEYYTHLAELNNRLANRFGPNYRDPLQYFNYDSSPLDQLAKVHGVSPASCRLFSHGYDVLHLNWLGCKQLGEGIAGDLVDCDNTTAL